MGDTKIIGKLTNAHSCLNLPGRGGGDGGLRCPKVVLCSNYSLFNANHKKWIM